MIPSIIAIENAHYLKTFLRPLSNLKTQFEKLSNGIVVATEELDSPLTCISLMIETGAKFENRCFHGISNFIEHMAMSSKDFEEILSNKSIKVDALTTREFQRFSAVCPTEYTSDCMEILSKIIFSIDLSDEEIQLQKMKTYSEAIDYDNNPELLVFDYLHQTAFQGTSLGQNVIGTTNTITQFSKEMISHFMNENYRPHRIVLATSGGESHSSMVSKANSTLGFLTPMECEVSNVYRQRYTGSNIIYRNDSMPFAHVAIAIEVPGYNSAEYLPLLVASCLTGSWDRTQGGTNRHGTPLARAAATSKLCEKFESFYIAYRDVGLWGLYFVGTPNSLEDMVANIQDQWMHICTTTDKSDVQRAVNMAKLNLCKRVDGVINSCYDIGLQVLYTSCRKNIYDFFNELSNITNQSIKSIGSQFFYDKCPVVAAVGPTEALPHYSRIRSGMYWIRL